MKKQNGITLIALVITIVVLLILAGVSISMVLGDNGILTKANESKTAMNNAANKEYIANAIAVVETEMLLDSTKDYTWCVADESKTDDGSDMFKAELGKSGVNDGSITVAGKTATGEVVFAGTFKATSDATAANWTAVNGKITFASEEGYKTATAGENGVITLADAE